VRPRAGTREACLPEDTPFLRQVYASTREQDLRLLGWSPDDPAGQTFIQMQFEAQTTHYANVWSSACWMVILADGQDAGRFITDRSPERIHIVDLSLLPRYRGLGVGGTLVRQLLGDADVSALPVTCDVAVDNDALGFWEHLGFRARDVGDAYVAMERMCETSPR
jgi:ribosomal protein S18 acetylase RimI-like enzyme